MLLQFNRIAKDRTDRVGVEIDSLIIAGWAGRDAAAIEHHIEELAALGVPRPSTTPLYYRVAAQTLTQSNRLVVLGPDSSGEVNPFSSPWPTNFGSASDRTTPTARPRPRALPYLSSFAANRSGRSFGPILTSKATGMNWLFDHGRRSMGNGCFIRTARFRL